ncbi:MAG: T9SS type A sorting domain-containing protein, partial [Flavobacteriales bacterium]|nr:T9SS type A sorting domain-containing protein [Flavobacteriales bacterium]
AVTDFVMYPNPASEEVYISFQNIPEQDLNIQITNTLGQVVYSSEDVSSYENNTISLPISGYASGLYFVSIKQMGATQIKKLVIK